ncbi:hypothetical protein C8Q79DRAFT_936204 [Trametes meyenii]|nr:hypothetical protein C8Q79DRAFT_936204 [Trametes meyenii]
MQGNSYLSLPSESERSTAYKDFYVATSNAALQMRVCAVCARRRLVMQHEMEEVHLEDLPGRERLHPWSIHPAHDLYAGCLLEPTWRHRSPHAPQNSPLRTTYGLAESHGNSKH